MPSGIPWKRRSRALGAAALSMIVLAGCTTVGPQSIAAGRAVYTDILHQWYRRRRCTTIRNFRASDREGISRRDPLIEFEINIFV